MRRLALAIIFALLSVGSVHGQKISAGVTFASEHYVPGEYNETNPGLFITRWTEEELSFGLGVGVFRNSYDRTALSGAARFAYTPHPWVRMVVSVGVVGGYGQMSSNEGPEGTVPLFTQSVRVGPPEVRVMAVHIGGAVGIGISFNNLLSR